MSNDLILQAKRNRSVKIVIGKFTFFARRPTAAEALRLGRSDPTPDQIAREFVDGWDGVLEDDIIGNGNSDPAKFDQALWHDWCDDRPDFWLPISSQILDAYKAHSEKLSAELKN